MFTPIPKCLNFLTEVTKEKGEVIGWNKAASQETVHFSANSVNS